MCSTLPYKDPEKAKQYWKIYHSKPEQRRKKSKREKRKYHENLEESRRRGRNREKKYRVKTRLKVLTHYGGNPPKCACCGEEHIEFLSIDHIAGGGDKHRKKIGGSRSCSSLVMYRWLIKNNFPKGFRILCYNCNCASGFYGYCPHQMTKENE